MASYAQLKKRLKTLQREVESARQAELLPIIRRMQREMATHGILPTDLGAMVDRARSAVKNVTGKRSVKGAGTPKYRDPKSGLTWSGFGRAPAWIAEARDRTKFLIGQGNEADESSVTLAKAPSLGRPITKKTSSKKSAVAATKDEARAPKKRVTGAVTSRSAKDVKVASAPPKKGSSKVPEATEGDQPQPA